VILKRAFQLQRMEPVWRGWRPDRGGQGDGARAAWTTQRDGYSPTWPPATVFRGGQHGRTLRVALKPVDGLKIDLGADFMIDGNKAAFAGFNQGTSTNPTRCLCRGWPLPPPAQSLYEGYLVARSGAQPSCPDLFGQIDYALDDLSITSITSYRHLTAMTGANWKAPRSTCCNS
jgi:iron complex outermembrane receptor protein